MGFFTPNISAIDNYYDKGRFLLAWRISIAFTLIFTVLAIIYGLSNADALLPICLTLVVTVSSAIYLRTTLNFKPLFWVYAISGTLITNFAMNYVLDFTHYVDFVWMTACILLAFVGLGWIYGVFFIGLNLVGIGYFFWFTLNRHIEILQPKTNLELIADLVELSFAFFVIAYLMRQFVLFQKYSESSLKQANADLENRNQLILSKSKENETLVKEIHHRVKNNLQIIISLLRMQSTELKSEESKSHFTEAINRIMAMSLIHQKLYGEKELSKIELKSYAEELVKEIISVSDQGENISVTIDSNMETMNIDTIVPLGLLINELVSNSLKHAFSSDKKGVIELRILQKEDHYELTYSDSGTWKAIEEGTTSFGLELVDILTEQMNGEKTLNTDNGTHYQFILKDTINA
ncbi:MAG: sensor histidine kinase [Crocinitomicaceae bacterium]|nr:sensor histidine kinase [Crocinitomicaceae bacterium]